MIQIIRPYKIPTLAHFWVLLLAFICHRSAMANDKGAVQLGVGFGEIPFMSDSLKPALSFGYFVTDQAMVNFIYQGEDTIQRDEESYNTEFGWQGLRSSRESVGRRLMLQGRYYFLKSQGLYLSTGMVYGGGDVEIMDFDARQRSLAGEAISGSYRFHVERRAALRPAVGLGFERTLTSGLSVFSDFTMDFFHQTPKPHVTIETGDHLSSVQRQQLRSQIQEHYRDNFHNRYHQFNLGIGYRY